MCRVFELTEFKMAEHYKSAIYERRVKQSQKYLLQVDVLHTA